MLTLHIRNKKKLEGYFGDDTSSGCTLPMVELEMVLGINTEGNYLVEEPF